MASIAYLRAMRARAVAAGDRSQVRALDADLDRSGAMSPDRFETATVELPERAVPDRPRRGRPPRPRCEHGQIVGRCSECEGDDV